MKRVRKAWQDKSFQDAKNLHKVLSAIEAAVDIITNPTDGEVPGLDVQYTAPQAGEADTYNDNTDGKDFPELQLYHMTKLSEYTAEFGETLTDLTTGFHSDQLNQRKDTTFGMWQDSYHDQNEWEDPDLKLGDKQEDNTSKDMQPSAVQPPYTNSNEPLYSPLTDTDRDTYNVQQHASKDAQLQQSQIETGTYFGDAQFEADGPSYFATNNQLSMANKQSRTVLAEDETKKTLNFQGIDINIEWPANSLRTYEDGYCRHMPADYGYIIGVNGTDGEGLDCYVGTSLDSNKVFVIEQRNKDTGEYDEDKIMLGFSSEDDAIDCYLASMDKENLGQITETSIESIKQMLDKATKAAGVGTGVEWPEGNKEMDNEIDPLEQREDLSIPRPPDTEQMKYR